MENKPKQILALESLLYKDLYTGERSLVEEIRVTASRLNYKIQKVLQSTPPTQRGYVLDKETFQEVATFLKALSKDGTSAAVQLGNSPTTAQTIIENNLRRKVLQFLGELSDG